MTLLPNWKQVLTQAWSVRFTALATIFGALAAVELPGVPSGLFAALASLAAALAGLSRVFVQEGLTGVVAKSALLPAAPSYTRMRYWFMTLTCGTVLGLSLKYDPFGGAGVGTWFLFAGRFFFGVAAIFFAYRALHDYPEADGRTASAEALKGNIGAAGILINRGLVFIALALLFSAVAQAQDVRTYIPASAKQHVPELVRLQAAYWPQAPKPWTMAAMAEHESCVRLTSPKCWTTKAALKTEREEGVGPTQITRAFTYKSDGTRVTRFDSLADARRKHPELINWSWDNVYTRMDYHLLAMVLLTRDSWTVFRHTDDPMPFITTAHNRGQGGISKEIQACKLKAGCNPKLWWGNVETTCTASRKPLYGGRSACDISREHARSINLVRAPKYKQFWG